MSFRETILHEALVIFEQKGIEEISTETLLDTLGISRGTLHEIANSKRELVQECITHSINVRLAVADRILAEAEHPLEALLQLLQLCIEEVYSFSSAFVHDLQQYYPQSWSRLQVLMRRLARTYVQPLLAQCIGQGYLNDDLPPELAARLFLNHIYGLLNPKLFPAFAFEYQELFKIMVIYYLKGCATEQGQTELEEFTNRTLVV